MNNEIEKTLEEIKLEIVERKFDEYLRNGVYVNISDTQAKWVLDFIKTII